MLARDAKRGDSVAYDILVRRYLRPAMAIAWEFTRRLEDAEDVTQEAFHRAVRALDRYDDRRPFRIWFFTILRNVARNAVAKDRRRNLLAPVEALDEEPTTAAVDPVVAGDLDRAIESLAPMQQACLRLGDVEGFSSVEIAHMLGVAEGTVRTHLHRARKRLRTVLSGTQGAT